MLERMPQVGEYVRYLGGEGVYSNSGLEIGGVYEVTQIHGDSVEIKTGDITDWVIFDSDFAKYELVEPVNLEVDDKLLGVLAAMATELARLKARVDELEAKSEMGAEL